MKCTGHSSQTGKPCENHAMRGTNVCWKHGGKAPQVMRKAEERYAEARDDALYLLALQLSRDVEEVQKARANGVISKRSTEYRDLLSTVKDLTTQLELWAGRATSHVETTEVQVSMHAFIVSVEPLVIPAKRPEFMRAISEARLGSQGEIAA